MHGRSPVGRKQQLAFFHFQRRLHALPAIIKSRSSWMLCACPYHTPVFSPSPGRRLSTTRARPPRARRRRRRRTRGGHPSRRHTSMATAGGAAVRSLLLGAVIFLLIAAVAQSSAARGVTLRVDDRLHQVRCMRSHDLSGSADSMIFSSSFLS